VIAALRRHSPTTPLLYFWQGGPHLLEGAVELPVDALSVDWRLPLSEVRRRVGAGRCLQGNLDPAALFAPPPAIERAVDRLLAEGAGGPHVVNLGHGILPTTPVEHARAFVRAAQERSG
jgi:uroporphyrinogen decarboxylase